MSNDNSKNFQYDAFISYSWADKAFAVKLEKALEAYKPPKDLNVPPRHLIICRDEGDFTGPSLPETIKKHLQKSTKLLVICSPNARKSEPVNDEVRWFSKLKGPENIIPVLFSGIPNNKATPEQEDEKAFPQALCEVLQIPLATNYREFNLQKDKINKGNFENSWYTILANLYGISRDEVEQRDRKRQARQRRIRTGIIFALAILAGVAWWQKLEAEKRKKNEKIQLAYNYWENGRRTEKEGNQLLALHFIAEAINTAPPREDPGLAAQQDIPEHFFSIRLRQGYQHEESITGAIFSKDERRVLTWSDDDTARMWDADTGTPIGQDMQHQNNVNGVVLSKDEKRILTWSWDGSARLWQAETGTPLGLPMQHEDWVNGAMFLKNEKRVLTWSNDGTARLWDVPGDLDFPNDKYVLQVQALTGTQFNPNTRQITVIPIDEWRKIQQQWLAFAREHAKTCQYQRQNVYLRFWGEEAKGK